MKLFVVKYDFQIKRKDIIIPLSGLCGVLAKDRKIALEKFDKEQLANPKYEITDRYIKDCYSVDIL